METDNPGKLVLTIPCHLKNGEAAEAVADGSQLICICVGKCAQLIEATAGPPSAEAAGSVAYFNISASQVCGVFGRIPLP